MGIGNADVVGMFWGLWVYSNMTAEGEEKEPRD